MVQADSYKYLKATHFVRAGEENAGFSEGYGAEPAAGRERTRAIRNGISGHFRQPGRRISQA